MTPPSKRQSPAASSLSPIILVVPWSHKAINMPSTLFYSDSLAQSSPYTRHFLLGPGHCSPPGVQPPPPLRLVPVSEPLEEQLDPPQAPTMIASQSSPSEQSPLHRQYSRSLPSPRLQPHISLHREKRTTCHAPTPPNHKHIPQVCTSPSFFCRRLIPSQILSKLGPPTLLGTGCSQGYSLWFVSSSSSHPH